MTTISMACAHRIWSAHREIETGTRLLADMRAEIANGNEPNPERPAGRQRNLQLGVPNQMDGHRIFNIAPTLAITVIEAHITDQKRELAIACVAARMELDGAVEQPIEASS